MHDINICSFVLFEDKQLSRMEVYILDKTGK